MATLAAASLDADAPADAEQTEDQNMHSLGSQDQPPHHYLGDVQDVEGPAPLLEAGQSFMLPLLSLPGLVLFPGDTLPLRLHHHILARPVDHALAAPPPAARLVAVVWTHTGDSLRSVVGAHSDLSRRVGCVAEIRQAGEDCVVARGRQRAWIDLTPGSPADHGDFVLARTTLLEDSSPPAAPAGALQGATWWGPSTWQRWDPRVLAAEACQLLAHAAPQVQHSLSHDPLELSFWLARSLPWDEHTRQQLLEEPSASHRLRREIALLRELGPICCGRCSQEVSTCASLVQISAEGPGADFVNPHAWVFHIVTLGRLACELDGDPTADDSWFEGFAWTCAYCECGRHLGWHFQGSTSPGAPRQEFYALRTSSAAAKTAAEHAGGGGGGMHLTWLLQQEEEGLEMQEE